MGYKSFKLFSFLYVFYFIIIVYLWQFNPPDSAGCLSHTWFEVTGSGFEQHDPAVSSTAVVTAEIYTNKLDLNTH